jgi:hypothetical protein
VPAVPSVVTRKKRQSETRSRTSLRFCQLAGMPAQFHSADRGEVLGEAAEKHLPLMQRILSLAVVATQLRTSAKGLGHDR